MQSIITKYHGPTNARGSRVSAKADAGKVILNWDHALNADDNHAAAARALACRLGWTGEYIGGHLPQSNPAYMCFVRQERAISPVFVVEAK